MAPTESISSMKITHGARSFAASIEGKLSLIKDFGDFLAETYWINLEHVLRPVQRELHRTPAQLRGRMALLLPQRLLLLEEFYQFQAMKKLPSKISNLQESPSTYRAHKKNTLWQLSSQVAELLWIPQEFNDFLQFLLSFVASLDIVEAHSDIFWIDFDVLPQLNSVTKIIS